MSEGQRIEDPNLAPNASAIVVHQDADGKVSAAVFHGRDIKQNSTPYQIVEQLLSAVVGVSNDAELLEDTTGAVPGGSGEIQEG